MKKGRPSWVSKVSRPALERIHDAIKEGQPSSAVFDRFHVAQYGCSRATFARYWRRRRRDWEDRQELTPREDRSVTAEELIVSLLESVQLSLDANRKIDSAAVNAISACVQTLKLDLNKEADKRANDKHEAWKAQWGSKVKAAVETKTEGGTKPVTREELYETIDRVLRGEEAA